MALKILVVEDEPVLLMPAVDLVEDAGSEALEASNATRRSSFSRPIQMSFGT